jgi:transposase InsO family protein
MVDYVKTDHPVSERRACKVLSIHRSSYRYQRIERTTSPAYQAVIQHSQAYDYWGYRKITPLIRAAGHGIGREQVRLIRAREGLQVPKKKPKRRRLGLGSMLIDRADYPGHVWSYDFLFDQTEDGGTLKCLTIVDEFSKLSLEILCSRSLTGMDVKWALERLISKWGAPTCIRSDNGSEFVARQVKDWLDKNDIGSRYIDPGCPWQNPFIESFNGILRTTCLNRWLFMNLAEARKEIALWKQEYNEIRPHGSLAGLSPLQFLRNFRRDNPKLNQMKVPDA